MPTPALFASMAGVFTAALGEAVTFSTTGGPRTFVAIVREFDQPFTDPMAGVVRPSSELRLATVDAINLAEGDTFTWQSTGYRIAGERVDDGRAMSAFDLERT